MKKIAEQFILREGFWSDHEDGNKNLPKAIAKEKAWKGKRKFLAALSKVEHRAQCTHFKGWSNCRCCEKKNGSNEFKLRRLGCIWIWPSGFSHYVEEHNIRPSLAFQDFILACVKPKQTSEK